MLVDGNGCGGDKTSQESWREGDLREAADAEPLQVFTVGTATGRTWIGGLPASTRLNLGKIVFPMQ